MNEEQTTAVLDTFRYGNTRVIHYGKPDEHGNTWPACGTRVGRYALPFHAGPEVTCKKCQTL